MSKKNERQINLLSFFLCHRFLVPWTGIRDEFYAGAFNEQAAKRKFERDKEDLRGIGIKIECVDKVGEKEKVLDNKEKELNDIEMADDLCGEIDISSAAETSSIHYDGSPRYKVIKDNLYLPDLSLTVNEKMQLYLLGKIIGEEEGFPLKDALRMAVNKLSFDAPGLDSKDEIEDFEKNFTFRLGIKNVTGKGIDNIEILDKAVVSSKKVSFKYYSLSRDKVSNRNVDPYGLMLQSGSWYLVGRCHDSDTVKVFKVTRIKGKVKVNKVKPKTPDYEVPDGFNVIDFYKKQPWDMGEEEACAVKVRVSPEYAWLVENQWGGKGSFRMEDNGSARLELKVRNMDAFIRWVLQSGPGVEVLSPEKVREKIKQKMECILKVIKG